MAARHCSKPAALALFLSAAPGLLCPTAVSIRSQKQIYWSSLVAQGVLDKESLARINCDNGPWEDFRKQFQVHVEEDRWNWADESMWVQEPAHWRLVKAAEALLETWRRSDYGVLPIDNLSVPESMHTMRREAAAQPLLILDNKLIAEIAMLHLERMSAPTGDSRFQSFGSSCFLGLIAASVVYSRALTELGESKPVASGAEDAFLLWRVEMAFLLAVMLRGEGILVPDLTAAPGWPAVSGHFVEQALHRLPEASASAMGLSASTSVLGQPQIFHEARPRRLPPWQRYHRATDPMGTTNWGRQAAERMELHASAVALALSLGQPLQWERLGPSWVPRSSGAPQARASSPQRVRFLPVVSQHGALDLEVPELLRQLFPELLETRYVLAGEQEEAICAKTQGSEVIASLCQERLVRLQGGRQAPEAPPAGFLRRDWILHPQDPRLFFPPKQGPDGMPLGGLQPPELISVCSFLEAVWVGRSFPGVPVLLFFGPPLLLDVAIDIADGRKELVADFWAGFWQLARQASDGSALVAAESLFRSEQFFYQTGVEVPFLRPMSVWVNASYRPRARGEVLVHNRGRLRYEEYFMGFLRGMAGPAFRFEIVAQAGRILPFEELAGFHAVVILPWSPELCMLRHIFRMWVPLFVPDRNLLVNLVHVSNQRLLPYPYYYPAPGSDRQVVQAVHPYDPFLDTALEFADPRGVAARAYWAEYSEYLLLPALRHFSSAADLLMRLHYMEGRKISAQMRAAYAQDMEEMHGFWAEGLSRLLGL